jgi:hypothetical protein
LESEPAAQPKCPICGQKAALEAGYVPQAADKYVALAQCHDHGSLFVRLRFALMEDGQVSMIAMVAQATKQNKAYVHTKQLQMENKQVSLDPDLMLRQVIRSSMPFEE